MRSSVLALSVVLPLIHAIDIPRHPHQPTGSGQRRLNFSETTPIASHDYYVRYINSWISADEDGQYIRTHPATGELIIEHLATGNSTVLISAAALPANRVEAWVSPDQTRVLWATNYTKQYRRSYFADYLIQDVVSGNTTALVPDQAGDIQYAVFAPVGSAIAFVRGNDLYITDNGTITQITKNGGPDMFNGVPDWVYEEEILLSRSALWFSPDGLFLAFLSLNETGVGTYTIPFYMDNQLVAPPYPREEKIRYPKVGTTNPTVELNILDITTKSVRNVPITAFEPNNTIIGEVAWVTDDHAAVVYRAFNRVQDLDKHFRVDPVSGDSKIVRERDGTDGWLDNTISISYIGQINSTNSTGTWYVDISDESGWSHLYLYPVDGGDAIPLTQGEWEVVSILKVDTIRHLIYYTSTEHHSTERHLYSINYLTHEKKALVNDKEAGYWSADFSSKGSYYILAYGGPDVPYQDVYSVNSTEPIRTVLSNEDLVNDLTDFSLPNITYFELPHPSGFTLNVMQRLPPSFDPTKRYPVLFTTYGGPGSQVVSKAFQYLGWDAYIASDPELEYITYTVDNRGTGYKGRAFRSTITGHLGRLETDDQIWAAQQLIAMNPFIDAERVGIYGPSYGAFLAAKVLEANSDVFSFGLIASSVSDYRLYDSMYTERYMKLLSTNEAGYNETAIRNATGFNNARGGFAITHSLSDDNVHFQNAAALLDLLVREGVSPGKMNLMFFTDSDHDTKYDNALTWLFRFLTRLLWEEKQRKVGGEDFQHQWG